MPYTKTKAVREARRQRAEEVNARSAEARKGKTLAQLRDEQFAQYGESKEYFKLCKKIDKMQAELLRSKETKEETTNTALEAKNQRRKENKLMAKVKDIQLPHDALAAGKQPKS